LERDVDVAGALVLRLPTERRTVRRLQWLVLTVPVVLVAIATLMAISAAGAATNGRT
jgi:hypothetical protein